MSGWEIAGLVIPVVLLFGLIVAGSWFWQWKRDPERFRESFRSFTRGFHSKGSGRP